MTPVITNEGLEALKTYIALVKRTPAGLNPPTPLVTETLHRIFKYGASIFKHEHVLSGSESFADLAAMKTDNERMGYLAEEYADDILPLIDRYTKAFDIEERNNLFSTQIGRMTGYEFERYLREIKILQ